MPALLLCCQLLGLSACVSTTYLPDGRRLWSAKADPRLLGDGLLVIFMPDDWPARMSGDEHETYGIWANILEAFVKQNSHIKEIRRVDFRAADEVFSGQGLPINEYSLLFVRKDGLALYAADPIFDGAVYDYAEAFLTGNESDFYWQGILHAGESEDGMPQSLKLVKLRASPPAPPATPSNQAAAVFMQLQLPPAPAPTLPDGVPAAPVSPASAPPPAAP